MTTYRLLYGHAEMPEPDFGEESSPEPAAEITRRLPGGLRRAVESAAASEGLSADAWLLGTVTRALGHGASAA